MGCWAYEPVFAGAAKGLGRKPEADGSHLCEAGNARSTYQ